MLRPLSAFFVVIDCAEGGKLPMFITDRSICRFCARACRILIILVDCFRLVLSYVTRVLVYCLGKLFVAIGSARACQPSITVLKILYSIEIVIRNGVDTL